MRLEILSPDFSVCKLHDMSGLDLRAEFTFLGSTDAELSLVCPTANAPRSALERSDGWRGFRVCGQLAFSLTGILAEIASTLAAESIPLFALSTFDTDYIFLKAEYLERARQTLTARGHVMNEASQKH